MKKSRTKRQSESVHGAHWTTKLIAICMEI